MSLERQRVFSAAPTSRKGHDIAGIFANAVACQQLGLLAEAQAGYKKVLKKSPNHFYALHLLGMIEHNNGNAEIAARLLKRALLVDPKSAAVHSDLSLAQVALGRLDEALASCDNAIALKADFANAYYNRGNALLGLGRFTEAVSSYDQTIAIDPHHADALNNRGNALHQLGAFADAITSYDRALTLKPGYVAALANRGAALKDLRQAEEAIADFDRALALAPGHAVAWTNRGGCLLTLLRGEEALASYDRALSIDPKLPEAWLGRANILLLTNRVDEALAACQRALALRPDSAHGLTQVGQCHALQGDAEAAVACFDRALAVKPDDEVALSSRIYSLDFSGDGDFARHQAARSEWWRQIGSKIAAQYPPHHDNDRDPNRRIVLGYVSAEFRHRSAAFSFLPVLQNHDKTRFEVICYSGSPTEDAVTGCFRQVADRWRDVLQWPDDRLADCIRSDKVDILVDLSGHGDGNRLRTFARKIAPIQATAWGHATGTGLPTIDYLLSDPVVLPAEVRHLYAEQIHDLPCAIIIAPPPAEWRSCEPPVTSNGYVTYGVFNRVSKLSNAVIAIWARILRSDVTSRLLIKHQLIDDPSVRSMLLEKFATHGIAPERLCLMGATSREEHLAAYRQVDICLDPFPHGGGVSTWETLHMGVPVVTKLGDGMASRVGGAILSSIGMTDWVAADDDQYVEIALRSAADDLRKIRHELPDLIDRRCSPAAYTGAVEAAYRKMWQKWCAESL
jgi:predicted O-linked N-acetylglucosamine transferase (SPINDLY family)